MHTIRTDHATNPGEVFGASSERADWPSPFRLAIQPTVAIAVGVHLAGAGVGAVIVIQSTGSPASFVSRHLPPELCFERDSAGCKDHWLDDLMYSKLSRKFKVNSTLEG